MTNVLIAFGLGLLSAVAVQMLQARYGRQAWERDRDERRLLQAATDLARLRVFVEEYNPNSLLLFFDPKDPFSEHHNWIAQWRPIRPDVTRIALLEVSLEDEIHSLIAAVLEMINVTGENLIAVSENRDVYVESALEAKDRALAMIRSISAQLAS